MLFRSTGNLSQFLEFDTTSNPGSTVVHISTTGGFTAGYDAKAEDQTIVLQNVNLRGTTVIVATHAKDLVETFRHRTLTLRKGKLVRDDPYGGYAL